jgi:hypothetical protein
MTKANFQESTSLVIVGNDFPDDMLIEKRRRSHPVGFFEEIWLRWTELFELLPDARTISWHEKIDFPDEELFFRTMRLMVESDSTPHDLYEEIVANTDGLTLRWEEFLVLVPSAAEVDWYAVAQRQAEM